MMMKHESWNVRRWSRPLMAALLLGVSGAGMTVCADGPSSQTQPDEPASNQPAERPSSSQPMVDGKPYTEPGDPWIESLKQDPDDPLVKKYAQMRKEQLEVERELKLIRAHHFRGIRNPEIRQEGIEKLKAYTDPTLYPVLLELFEREGRDVREAILDQLAAQKTDEADAALAWSAAFDKDEWQRAEALERLKARVDETGGVSFRVKSVVAAGLKRTSNREAAGAANLAWELRLFEAIPMLINAQVVPAQRDGGGAGGAAAPDGAIADIVIGTQQAFVADLQPVVGDSAVGFDPELGVVTDGVILRVMGAYVITYRSEVHEPLNRLASAGWGGKDVSHLGWDQRAWKSWYYNEYKPYRRELELAEKKAEGLSPSGPNG